MTTDNSITLGVTNVNRLNAQAKSLGAQIDALADRINDRCSDDGTEEGTPDTTVNTQVVAIVAAVVLINAQIDVLFPVQNMGNDYPNAFEAVVEDATPTKIAVSFTSNVDVTDGTGWTVAGSTLATTVSSAAAADNIVTLTMDGAVANGETVTVSYNGATGNVVNSADDSFTAESVTTLPVTNNVAA